MKLTNNQKKQYAEVCADAYVAQYLDDRAVMNEPMIYFSWDDEKFGWCSSLTPLTEQEYKVETLFEGCYGGTGEDVEIARAMITQYIMESADWMEIENIIF